MPLDKRWQGRRVVKAQRRCGRIFVRLEKSSGSSPARVWIELSPTEYRAGQSYEYLHEQPV